MPRVALRSFDPAVSVATDRAAFDALQAEWTELDRAAEGRDALPVLRLVPRRLRSSRALRTGLRSARADAARGRQARRAAAAAAVGLRAWRGSPPASASPISNTPTCCSRRTRRPMPRRGSSRPPAGCRRSMASTCSKCGTTARSRRCFAPGTRSAATRTRRRSSTCSPIADFNAYLATLNAKTRKNMRNTKNRLARSGTLGHRVMTDPADIAALVERAHAGRERWLADQGLTSRAFRDPTFGAFAAAVATPRERAPGDGDEPDARRRADRRSMGFRSQRPLLRLCRDLGARARGSEPRKAASRSRSSAPATSAASASPIS